MCTVDNCCLLYDPYLGNRHIFLARELVILVGFISTIDVACFIALLSGIATFSLRVRVAMPADASRVVPLITLMTRWTHSPC